jgi:hypothetical protein
MLCSPEMKKAIKEKGIELVGYQELKDKFLDRMTQPAD